MRAKSLLSGHKNEPHWARPVRRQRDKKAEKRKINSCGREGREKNAAVTGLTGYARGALFCRAIL